ncbi:hypothetical protein Tco_0113185 [Tanacetum coccineum]
MILFLLAYSSNPVNDMSALGVKKFPVMGGGTALYPSTLEDLSLASVDSSSLDLSSKILKLFSLSVS